MTDTARLALFAALATLPATTALAGERELPAPRCYQYPDGSGYCSGTLAAFNLSTNGSDHLVFQEYASSYGLSRYIQVTASGMSKFLSIPQSRTHVWNLFNNGSALYNANIYVHWDASGTIDAAQLYNSSRYYRGN